MATLKITIQGIEDTDFDWNLISLKYTKSTIDWEPTNTYCNCWISELDEDIKANHKSVLTENGFIWDDEI